MDRREWFFEEGVVFHQKTILIFKLIVAVFSQKNFNVIKNKKREMKPLYLAISLFCCVVNSFAQQGVFKLINNSRGAKIYYKGSEKVVNSAIDMFIVDSDQICKNPTTTTTELNNNTIIVGVLGIDSYIDQYLNQEEIRTIKNNWESFIIKRINLKGKELLVVAGNNPRGVAYGVLELSRKMGVSPWVWWADATPTPQENVSINITEPIIQMPSVKYRGVFLNDEDWALMPWSSKHFEQTSKRGAIGPKTYERIFQLLLRLRANTIWPAMHECTIPFYMVKGNKDVADKYGIVVGTSHCEPMMTCNTGEWHTRGKGAYNFKTNKENILNYWNERVTELADSENVYTIGMRGIHDGRMLGVNNIDEETVILEKIIAEQQQLLKKNFPEKYKTTPQVLVPYKEVLKVYNNGLKVPDDVTLMWCDDNNGYITRLSDAKEQKRKGGAGVYYHLSYWGKPHDYLWLASTQPGLIYKEMKRAWDYGAQKIWILNVGDIKPGEYLTEFFLDMAWNINDITPENIYAHQQNWLQDVFGKNYNPQMQEICKEYYHLNGKRKPEHMGWNVVESTEKNMSVHDSELNPHSNGDEIEQRIAAYQLMAKKSEHIYKSIPKQLKDCYFQLLHYPIVASKAINEKILYAQKSRLYATYNLPVSEEYAQKAKSAYGEIAALTYKYNHDISNGKWHGMMDFKPRDLAVFQSPTLPDPINNKSNVSEVLLWSEGMQKPTDLSQIVLPIYTAGVIQSYNISLLTTDKTKAITWEVVNSSAGIEVSDVCTNLHHERKICFTSRQTMPGKYTVELLVNKKNVSVICEVVGVGSNTIESKHIEKNGSISFDAKEYTNKERTFQTIQSLGHSMESVILTPSENNKNYIEYEFYSSSVGDVTVKMAMIPAYSAKNRFLRYAICMNNESEQNVSINADFLSSKWAQNCLRGQSVIETKHHVKIAGKQIIRIRSLDEPIYLDQILIDFNLNRKHYLIGNIKN